MFSVNFDKNLTFFLHDPYVFKDSTGNIPLNLHSFNSLYSESKGSFLLFYCTFSDFDIKTRWSRGGDWQSVIYNTSLTVNYVLSNVPPVAGLEAFDKIYGLKKGGQQISS